MYYESFSSGSDSEGPSDKPSKSRVRAEKENLHIQESGFSLNLNVAESEQIAASSIDNWLKQGGSVSLHVQNSAVFRSDARRNRFEAKS